MIKSIRKIEFSIGGYSQGNKTYRIDESGVTYCEDDGYQLIKTPKSNTARVLNPMQKSDLIKTLKKVDFINWKKDYWADVCDGEQWSLMVTYNGNLSKKVEGSNAYPQGFKKIQKLIEELTIK